MFVQQIQCISLHERAEKWSTGPGPWMNVTHGRSRPESESRSGTLTWLPGSPCEPLADRKFSSMPGGPGPTGGNSESPARTGRGRGPAQRAAVTCGNLTLLGP